MTSSLLWALLAYGLLPLWLICGVADYVCHRRTGIECTSGVRESLLHLLQTAEIAVPMLALLFLEINALVLGLIVAGAFAHTWTAYRDIRYAAALRRIPPVEQFIHAFLIMLPLMACALLVVLHWPQAQAWWHPSQTDAWTLAWKRPMRPWGELLTILALAFAFGVVPGLLEIRSILRYRKAAASARPGRTVGIPKPVRGP